MTRPVQCAKHPRFIAQSNSARLEIAKAIVDNGKLVIHARQQFKT
jgi:hypothetical protein